MRGRRSLDFRSADAALQSWLQAHAWDDWKQEIRPPLRCSMQRCHTPIDGRRAVRTVLVLEGTDPCGRLADLALNSTQIAGIDIIPAADGEPQTVACRRHDASGPDFDIQLVNISWDELLLLIVSVIGPMRRCAVIVELAMGRAQPAMCKWGMRVIRSREGHLGEIRTEQAQNEKQV